MNRNKTILFVLAVGLLTISLCQAAFVHPWTGVNMKSAQFSNKGGPMDLWAREVESRLTGTLNGGNIWYVNSAVTTGANGKSWATACKTVTAAVALASAGDTIYIKGTGFVEQVTLTLKGLRIIGAENEPNETVWSAAADANCIYINTTDVWIENIKFRPPARTSGSPAAIVLGAGSNATIRGCLFQGKATSYYAIYSPVCQSDNVTIEDCEFRYMNTATYGAAILGVEAGGLSYSGWHIRRNLFDSCVTNVNINGRCCEVTDNVFGVGGINSSGAGAAVCTLSLDLSGTSSYGNKITRNTFDGAYSTTLYKAGADGDCWIGNFSAVDATTSPSGVTVAAPD